MQITFAKIFALLVTATCAVIYIASTVAQAHSNAEAVIHSCEGCFILMIPCAMIWFPEHIGQATGYIGHGSITTETLPIFAAIMGWVILFALPVAAYYLHR